jgi:hypothetical protein
MAINSAFYLYRINGHEKTMNENLFFFPGIHSQ